MKITQTVQPRDNSTQSGFSLIEVLIALVVLSIGLIGMAGIQQAGVRNNHNALLHSQASMLAYEIGDMMRSNMIEVEFGNYNVADGIFPTESSICASTELVTAVNCSSQEMAIFHLKRWSEHLEQRLPEGSGTIFCQDIDDTFNQNSCSPGSTVVIEVSWTESDIGGAERMSFTTEVQL